MATITVKDIPEELYEALKKKAAEHHRSINREVIHCIQQIVRGHDHDEEWDDAKRMTVDEILEEVRRLRQEIGPPSQSAGRKGTDTKHKDHIHEGHRHEDHKHDDHKHDDHKHEGTKNEETKNKAQ